MFRWDVHRVAGFVRVFAGQPANIFFYGSAGGRRTGCCDLFDACLASTLRAWSMQLWYVYVMFIKSGGLHDGDQNYWSQCKSSCPLHH